MTCENPTNPTNSRRTCDGRELQGGMDVGHVDGDAGAELRLDLVLVRLLPLVLLGLGDFGRRPGGVQLTGSFLLLLGTLVAVGNLVDC